MASQSFWLTGSHLVKISRKCILSLRYNFSCKAYWAFWSQWTPWLTQNLFASELVVLYTLVFCKCLEWFFCHILLHCKVFWQNNINAVDVLLWSGKSSSLGKFSWLANGFSKQSQSREENCMTNYQFSMKTGYNTSQWGSFLTTHCFFLTTIACITRCRKNDPWKQMWYEPEATSFPRARREGKHKEGISNSWSSEIGVLIWMIMICTITLNLLIS